MVKIIKEELSLEESLKKKIEFIREFAKVQPTIINSSIRKIDKTNLTSFHDKWNEKYYKTYFSLFKE